MIQNFLYTYLLELSRTGHHHSQNDEEQHFFLILSVCSLFSIQFGQQTECGEVEPLSKAPFRLESETL